MLKDFFDGIRSYSSALAIIKEKRLWGFLLAPGLISLLLAAIIGVSAWSLSGSFGHLMMSWYPFEWGADFMNSLAGWLGGIILGLVGLIFYKHLVMVIVSPFMSPLSQKVEESLRNTPQPYAGFQAGRALRELSRGLYLALRNIIRELFFVLLLLLLGFIPIVGMVTTVLIFMVQAYYAGFGNLDYFLERHYAVKGSVKFVKRYRGLAIGNGSVFLLLLFTGIGFLIAPPLATVAATIEGVKRLPIDPIDAQPEDEWV